MTQQNSEIAASSDGTSATQINKNIQIFEVINQPISLERARKTVFNWMHKDITEDNFPLEGLVGPVSTRIIGFFPPARTHGQLDVFLREKPFIPQNLVYLLLLAQKMRIVFDSGRDIDAITRSFFPLIALGSRTLLNGYDFFPCAILRDDRTIDCRLVRHDHFFPKGSYRYILK